jgi:glycosyltransferase involved in cell wall biosynthesis
LLLPAAPWTATQFAKELALEGRFAVLPVITTADAILPPSVAGNPRLITVLALDSWQRKGLDTLAKAAVLLKPRIPELVIEVYGSGSPKSLLDVRRMLAQTGAEGLIRLMGPVPHGNVQPLMNNYAGFLMPTRRETYGMVHVEAVLAGVPILFSRDRGIDGLLDGDVGYRCDPSSLEDVAAGIAHLVEHEAALKANIKRLQGNGALEHLRRDAIGVRYRALTTGLLDAASPALNLLPPFAADSPRPECRFS